MRPSEVLAFFEDNNIEMNIVYAYYCVVGEVDTLSLSLSTAQCERVANVVDAVYLEDRLNRSVSLLAEGLVELIDRKGISYVLTTFPRDLANEI